METKKNILILEDEEGTLALIDTILKKQGYNVHPFRRPDPSCIKTLTNEKIDLFLLDLGLPGFKEEDLIHFIRNNKIPKDVPLMIVSSRTPQEIQKSALDLSAKDWMSKPLNVKELLQKIGRILSLN